MLLQFVQSAIINFF